MKVSIIIVSYQAKNYLEHCLNSVFSLDFDDFEAIVIDNASQDGSLEYLQPKFPQVRWLKSKKNLGFGKANNLAVQHAKGEFLLLLNPDTFLPENLLTQLLPFAQKQNNIGAIGVRLIDGNGKFHPESKRNIPTAKNTFGKSFGFLFGQTKSNYYQLDLKEKEVGQTPILVGAFMFLKKNVFVELGGFDEDFFMYGEDIDLSYRLILKGYKNYYFGKSTVIHYKGKSSNVYSNQYLKNFYGAMQIFLDKHYKNKVLSYFLLSLGIKLRFGLTKFLFAIKRKQDRKVQPRQDIVLQQSDYSNLDLIQTIEKNTNHNKAFFIETKNAIVGNEKILTKPIN